ncbi:MAG: substrate-binding domain-containing protein [Lachnospiraceae bacterium]|nr:substrate-binding domain-containing protein [Lachnospiraceae bacterium]
MKEYIKKRLIADRYEKRMIVFLLILLLIIIGIFAFVHIQLQNASVDESTYNYHYVFISKSEDSYTANHIFEEARDYGKPRGIYVERLKENLNLSYTNADYIKMAAAMNADGIFVEASAEDEIKESINDTSNEGIPVVTILSDCPGSRRKSFVELGQYNLGREYGRIVIDVTKTRSPEVMVLVDDDADSGTIQIINGIKETLENEGNHLEVQFVEQEVDGTLNFRFMNKVNDILSAKRGQPDIIICLNVRDTQMVYQAIKDYSISVDAQIIGTGISESLLKSIKEGDFVALVDANATQAGMMCVDSMTAYLKNGNINEHIIVEDTIVTKENVERYLNEE